jgi:organic radical activating enzyme
MPVNRNNLDQLYKIHLDKSDEISPTFCSAKWHMVTLHLAQGETHSCYHPWTHKVPIEEIQSNPGAIHNTNFKKSQRKLMLEGTRPKECQYCWNMEDLGNISDRVIRNAEVWAKDDLDIFKGYTGDEDVFPRHVEVSFSTTCNLKCSYCNPTVSSKWLEEVQKHGGYKTSTQFNDYIKPNQPLPFILDKEYNPYIEAFWKWLPEAYKHMRILRVTGGEPLLSKHTFTLMDFISKNPNPSVEFIVNSNLCVPDKIVDELIDSAKTMVTNNAISSFKLFASLDSVGEQAEYQRHGLDFEQFKRNVIRVLEEVPKGKVSFTCTFNVFSVPKVKEFMEYMKSLIDIYGDRINFDTPYLRYPPHQCIQILPSSYDKYLADAQAYMESVGFKSLPIEKIKRLRSYMANVTMTEEEIATYRKDFKIFVDEHDRRRNTNFAHIYPELLIFYNNI